MFQYMEATVCKIQHTKRIPGLNYKKGLPPSSLTKGVDPRLPRHGSELWGAAAGAGTGTGAGRGRLTRGHRSAGLQSGGAGLLILIRQGETTNHSLRFTRLNQLGTGVHFTEELGACTGELAASVEGKDTSQLPNTN